MILDGILSWLGIRATPGQPRPSSAPCPECARLRRLCSSQEDIIAKLEGRPVQAMLPPIRMRTAGDGDAILVRLAPGIVAVSGSEAFGADMIETMNRGSQVRP